MGEGIVHSRLVGILIAGATDVVWEDKANQRLRRIPVMVTAQRNLMRVVLAVLLAWMTVAVIPAFATTYQEDTIYTLLRNDVVAGDDLICEVGQICGAVDANSRITDSSNISDVAVFYNSAKGPYVADRSSDADSFRLFSDDAACNTGFSLCDFLLIYDQLSSNVGRVQENPAGLTPFGTDFINSPEGPSPVPEPSTLSLLGSGLIGLATILRRKLNAPPQK
jgi:hypothetical protein